MTTLVAPPVLSIIIIMIMTISSLMVSYTHSFQITPLGGSTSTTRIEFWAKKISINSSSALSKSFCGSRSTQLFAMNRRRPINNSKGDYNDDSSRTRRYEDDDYDGYYYDDEEDIDNDDYFLDDEYDEEYYEEDDNLLDWEWETFEQNTHIYLPPPIPSSYSQVPSIPKTVIHFIGGTLFGSYPLQFYKQFLESIAQQTNTIIIATSIPITFAKNPLNHYDLTYKISKQFRLAFEEVVCDEYGYDEMMEDGVMNGNVKIIGVGHSLGCRLHTIISTDDIVMDDNDSSVDDGKDVDQNQNQNQTKRKKKNKENKRTNIIQKIALPRTANILLSFNNYSALSSVPGVQSLEKGVRSTRKEEQEMKDRLFMMEQKKRQQRRRRRSKSSRKRSFYDYDDGYDDEFDNEYSTSYRSRRRCDKLQSQQRRSKKNEYDDYLEDNVYDDDYDDDDLELRDVVTSIKSSLTPDIDKSSLEFRPTPDELWDKITMSYCKNVKKTLIVQFDNDRIDQSSRLAQAILDSNNYLRDKRKEEKQQQHQEQEEGSASSTSGGRSSSSSTRKVPEDGEEEQSSTNRKKNKQKEVNKIQQRMNPEEVNKESSSSELEDDEDDFVLFARLKGTHLNPLSYSDTFGLLKAWKRISVLPMDDLLKDIIDEEESTSKMKKAKKKQREKRQNGNLNSLINSVSRYINDIV